MSTALQFLLLLVISGLLFLSCPGDYLENEDLLRSGDTISPVIVLRSPAEGDYFAAALLLEGQVSDLATIDGTPGRPEAYVHYEILGHSFRGTIALKPDGSFKQVLSAVSLQQDSTLRVWARDWHENEAEVRVFLRKNAFPAFTLLPGHRQVELNWVSPDAGAAFTLFYLEGSGVPSEADNLAFPAVSPGSLLTNLQNGRRYSLILRARTAGGAEHWSEVKEVVPLSPFSLLPLVSSGYREVRLSWPAPPGVDQYIIRRATAPEGPFAELVRQWDSNEYTDTGVVPGTTYYYTVQPDMEFAVESYPAWAEASPFVEEYKPAATLALPLNGALHKLALQGDYLYAVSLYQYPFGGLLTFDISNPCAPRLTSDIQLPNNVNTKNLWVTREALFVVREDDRLQLYELTDPSAPLFVREFYTGEAGSAEDVVVAGDYAYVADGENGLDIFKLSDPDSQRAIASPLTPVSAPQLAQALALQGDYLYVALALQGRNRGNLLVFDVSDPAAPVPYGPFPTVSNPLDLEIRDNILYVADGQAGLQLYDISAPLQPVHLAGLDPGNYIACDVRVSGAFAYLAANTGGLFVVNVADPANPVLAGSYNATLQAAQGIVCGSRYAFVADHQAGLLTFDITAPLPGAATVVVSAGYTVGELAVYGNYLYAATGNAGLGVFDLAQPGSPQARGAVPTRGTATAIRIAGGFAFVSGENEGLEIYDLSRAALPTLFASSPAAVNTGGLALQGEYALVCSESDGGSPQLSVLALSGISAPEPAGSLMLPGLPGGIELYNRTALVTLAAGGVELVDLALLPHPVRQWDLGVNGVVAALKVRGDYAFAAVGAGLEVFDLTDMSAAGSCALPAPVEDLALNNRYAFLSVGSAGLQVVDLREPERPLSAGFYPTSGAAGRVVLKGGYAYVGNAAGELEVVSLIK